eukprot:10133627-Ditylum_brightwellii.AAC.1
MGTKEYGKTRVCFRCKFPSTYILDKEQPPIERMIIAPLKSPYDESAGFGNNNTNCTTEGET